MKAERLTPHPDNATSQESIPYDELLAIAHDEGLKSIATQLLANPTDDNGHRAIVKAVVEVEKGHFEALGDADPSNVDPALAPHLIRVAEDRAKARALRDAVNCGIASQEELGGSLPEATSRDPGPGASDPPPPSRPRFSNGSVNRGTPPRGANRSAGQDGPMSEAQRRYLFRLVAGRGYPGARGEEFLKDRLGVERLAQATRADASALIDELVQSSAPARGNGHGATPHHQH
jgi:hypothetical protein